MHCFLTALAVCEVAVAADVSTKKSAELRHDGNSILFVLREEAFVQDCLVYGLVISGHMH